jgi:predicted RNase H-like HicB family nuclease
MNYIAIIERDPGSLYGGHFPDVPGAYAAGATLDECTRSALDALRVWATDATVDGEATPPARTLDEVVADPEVAAALARGAVAIAVPLIVDVGRQTRVNVSLDVGTLAAIDEAAKRRGMTRSAFLAAAGLTEAAKAV